MGQAFLRAYEVTNDPRYLALARDAAHALALGQLESGGWDYLVDFDPAQASRWYRRADRGLVPAADRARRRNLSTYDDDTSQSAVRFLLACVAAAERAGPANRDPRDAFVREARDYALAKLREAQYPNGAWPQRYDGIPKTEREYPVLPGRSPADWPRDWPKPDYRSYYTLNDHTQRDCIRTMLEAYHRLGDRVYLDAARRGGEFLIRAQLPEPQPAWAQQYNSRMEPAWARAFEPPAVCSAESAGAVLVLLELFQETRDGKYLEPIPRTLAWFQRSALGPNRWARYYELGTNRPIYGDRDGKIHYTLEELSEERRTGYAWQGSFNIPVVIRAYETLDRERPKKEPPRPTAEGRADRARVLAPRVRSVIAALDEQGRWVTRGRLRRGAASESIIDTRVFIESLGILCDYLEAKKSP